MSSDRKSSSIGSYANAIGTSVSGLQFEEVTVRLELGREVLGEDLEVLPGPHAES